MTKKRISKSTKLNKYLRDRRVELALTQKEVADTMGLESPQYISNFERDLNAPSLEFLRKLMKLYKIPKTTIIEILIEDRQQYLKKVL